MEALNDIKQGLNPAQKTPPAEARTLLIKRHQTKKTLEEEMKLLKGSTDETKLREYYVKLLKFCIILAFEAVSMNMKELDAIKFIESQPTKSVPPPPEEKKGKPEIYTIPAQAVPAPRKMSGGAAMPVQEFVDKRWQFQKDAFKPGYPLPTMSLEEYGAFEKERMVANTEYGFCEGEASKTKQM